MNVSAISNSNLYQLIPSSGQPGAATAAQANPAILPVDDFYSGIPQSISFAMGLYTTTVQTDWTALGKSLSSGDASAAQTALQNYTQSLADSNDSMSSLTTPSDQFKGYLAQIGDALSSGDLSKAQSVYGTAQWWGPTSPLIATGEAVDAAAIDGAKTTNWMQDEVNFAGTLSPGTSYTPPAATSGASTDGAGTTGSGTSASSTSSESADDKFTADLVTVQSMIHEEDSNLGSFLLQQGYSQTDVNSIVNVLDYNNMTATLGTVTGDIADITKNTDTFTVSRSIGNISTSGNSGSVVVNSSTETFQGDSSIGSSSVTGAQAHGGTSSTSSSVSGESEAFFYSFSIVETKSDGTSTQDSTSGSAYSSTDSTSSVASSLASVSKGKQELQLVKALTQAASAQTASDVKDITSSPIVPLAEGENPADSPYYSMMTKSANASMSQVESVLADVLGSSATMTASATSSMSGSDGKNEAYSSVSVYA